MLKFLLLVSFLSQIYSQSDWYRTKKRLLQQVDDGEYPFKIATHHGLSTHTKYFKIPLPPKQYLYMPLPTDLGMAVTQNLTIFQQQRLNTYIYDIRISKINKKYMVAHTLGFFSLQKAVALFKNLKNKDFMILIRFDSFGSEYMDDSDVEEIRKIFGDELQQKWICESSFCEEEKQIVENKWFNKDDPQELLTAIEEYQAEYANRRKRNDQKQIQIIQFILTGQGSDAVLDGGVEAQDNRLVEYVVEKINEKGSPLDIPVYPEQYIMVDYLSLNKLYLLQKMFKLIKDD